MTARTGEIARHSEWIEDLVLKVVIRGMLCGK